MGRFLLTVFVGLILFAAAAWYLELPLPASIGGPNKETRLTGKQNKKQNPTDVQQAVIKRKLGGKLYKAEPFPKLEVRATGRRQDPVIIAAHFSVMDKLEVPSPLEGKLLYVGEGVPSAAVAVTGAAAFMSPPFQVAKVNRGSSTDYKFYRRLYENEPVYSNQVVAMLNPARALGELDAKSVRVDLIKAQNRAAEYTYKEAQARMDRARPLYGKGVIPPQEWSAIILTRDKYHQEYISKGEEVKFAQIELKMAEMIYKQHFIRNELPVPVGIVKKIAKARGEEVKKSEPIMSLYSIERLQAEGSMEVQYLRKLKEWNVKRTLRVALEPTVDESPARVLKIHRKKVTGVAVSKNHLVLSASEDRTVAVWDPDRAAPLRVWQHEHPVHVIACSPPAGKQNLCLAGLANGDICIYDLETMNAEPVKTIEGAHRAAVTAVAFSPDGKWFATGGLDNQIQLWNVEDHKVAYRFGREDGVADPHNDSITSLHFTPQCKLVSASRDNTLRVWSLHEKGAALEYSPVVGRSGSVTQLGVSQNGQWMLFDQGKILQLLSVKSGLTKDVLENPTGAIPFETTAVFSPNASLILTAGAPEGRLQLWRSPTDGQRGYEVRQFTTLERSPVSCAMFAPGAGLTKTDNSFAVSGAENGYVYLWDIPSPDQVDNHRITDVKLSMLGGAFDAAANLLRVGVVVGNGADDEQDITRLLPGRPVTIVFESVKKVGQ